MTGMAVFDGDRNWSEPSECPVDLTKAELTSRIAQLAGHSPPGYGYLSKELLNSIHAYLTGEFIEKPEQVFATGGLGIADYRLAVASTASIDGYPGDPADAGQFSRDTLADLFETMRATSDLSLIHI